MATPFVINARTAVAATATSTATSRVYFQDTDNGIREVTYDNGNWTVSNDVLFSAKRSTPLAVISWDEGKQVKPLTTPYSGENIDRKRRFGSTVFPLRGCFKSGAVSTDTGVRVTSQIWGCAWHQTLLSLLQTGIKRPFGSTAKVMLQHNRSL